MEYMNVGASGLKISRISLGGNPFGNSQEWMLEIDRARPIILKAIDLGVTFFDTSNYYSHGRSEEILGEVVKDRRNDLVISTKLFQPVSNRPNDRGLSRIHMMQEIDRSLKRLGTDYIDLYQMHRWDYDTPISETLHAFNDLVHAGKTLYIGASSMYAWQFSKALWTSDRLGLTRFISMENNYSLCYREEELEMIPLCKDQGIGLICWSPLGKGFLTGKYKRGETPDSLRYRSDPTLRRQVFRTDDFDILDEVERVAKEKDVKPSQIALAWLLHKEGVVSPIVGATKVEHVEEAVEALNIRLTPDDIRCMEAAYKPHPIYGHD